MNDTAIDQRAASGGRIGSRILGWFATPLSPRRYLELIHPFWGSEERLARVERVVRETADVTTLVLRPNRRFSHRAGQHLAVGVTIRGVRHTRVFSISSAPNRADGCFTITVKSKGLVSSFLNREIAARDVVVIGEPEGDFVLPAIEELPARVLFLTAGSGITPVMAMARDLARRAPHVDVVHLHCAKDADDVIFARELARMRGPRYRLELLFSRDATAPERFDATTLNAKCPDFLERNAWACGPASWLAAIESQYAEAGISNALKTERFGATFARAPADECGGGLVRFHASDKTVRADGKTPLLVVAEQAGLAPPHGCRMGICHTCDATLRGGCVRDLRTGELHSEPGTRIRICVSAAMTDLEIDR